MGIVHETIDRLTGDVVAFKQVHLDVGHIYTDSMSPEDTLESLRMVHAREFQILAGLRHPNIISVLDYGFDEAQQPFFTMDYLRESETFVEAGAELNFDQKIDLIEQLLQGLAYLHRRGILHRDIKPENVLVTNGVVRLLDFGLSQQLGEHSGRGGSPLYIAPEIVDGDEPTPASDIYSVGILLHELLVGIHPYSMKIARSKPNFLWEKVNWTPLDPRLEALQKRLTAQNPAERYQSAGEVLHDLAKCLNRPFLKETKEIRESYLQAATFVGREKELDELQQPLFETEREKGHLFLLGGESGVGKSRLLDELRSRALVAGWQVAVGQEAEGARAPYQLWHDIILRLSLNVELNDLDAGVLNEVVPSLEALLEKRIPAPSKLEGTEGELRFALTLISLLRQQEQPTLLILEDLHWSEESLVPLKQLAKVLEQLTNVMIVGSYRNDERPDLVIELAESESIQLERLNDSEITQLSKAMLGDIGERSNVVSLLTKETEGNTFFIVEVMRALAEEAGQLTEIGEGGLPSAVATHGIAALLQRRINKIDQADLPLLQLMAVAGRRIDLDLLEVLAATGEHQRWLQAVSEAAVLSLRDGQWMFSHDKIRHATLSQLDPEQLKSAHRQVATQIEALYPEEERFYSALLAHWQAAGDDEKELEYLVPVAKRAIHTVDDYELGYQLVSRGLALKPKEVLCRIELLNLQASLLVKDSKFDQGEAISQEVYQLASEADDMEGQAASLRTLGVIRREQSQYSEAQEYFHRAMVLSTQSDNPTSMASCLIQLGVVAEFQKNYEEAENYFKQSLAIYQLIEDQLGVTKSYFYLGMIAAQHHNDFEKSLEYAQKNLEIFEAVGNHRRISRSYTSMGIDYASTGRYETALEHFEKGLVIKESFGETAAVAHTYLVMGEAYFFEGVDFHTALFYSKKSLDLYLELKILAVIGIDYGYITLSHIALGNYAEALQYAFDHFKLQSTIENDKSNGLVHIGVARLLFELERGGLADPYWEQMNGITDYTQLEATSLAYIQEAIRVSTIAQIRLVVLIECGLLALQIGEEELALEILNEALERAKLVKNEHKIEQIHQILHSFQELAD